MAKVFSILMRTAVTAAFTFPKGGIATRAVSSCLGVLDGHCQRETSDERIVDFCVCQVYAISRFDAVYLKRWKVSHSFGQKALERFAANQQATRYYEDRWLRKYGLSRGVLVSYIRDRREHPLFRYVFPRYEEVTKERALNTTVGYYICGISTLLWTPFSPACQQCCHAEACRERTRLNYPELYRIRTEEYNNRNE